MKENVLKKVVILGPESTGKSTLCEKLAAHYNTIWCREYAREYLTEHGMNYSFYDLKTIGKGQLQSEAIAITEAAKNQSPVLFIDTDMYVMKVWCEYVFQRCHHFILEEIALRQYDLYLLCNIDLPWKKEPLREYEDEQPRIELFSIYKDIMENQRTPYTIISGVDEERLSTAIRAINISLDLQ